MISTTKKQNLVIDELDIHLHYSQHVAVIGMVVLCLKYVQYNATVIWTQFHSNFATRLFLRECARSIVNKTMSLPTI